MSMDLIELQQIFEYELKRKLAQKSRSVNDEIRHLYNAFKFYDIDNSLVLDKNSWIKGILKTGLCGFGIKELDMIFSRYDINSTGLINYKNFTNYIYNREELIPIQNNNIQNNNNFNNNFENLKTPNPNVLNRKEFKPPGLYERIIEQPNNVNNNTNQKNNINNINISNNNINKKNINNQSNNIKDDESSKKLILLLQNKINTNNGITYYTFAKKIKSYENHITQTINIDNFYSSLRDISVNFSIDDLTNLFKYFDQSKTGNVPTENLLKIIKGNISEKRKSLIIYQFSLLDKNKIGEIPINYLKNIYNANAHPDVITGFKQDEEVFNEFCYTFDIFCKLNNINNNITYAQFLEYYTGISASIVDDNYFEDIICSVWSNNNNINNINNTINIINNFNERNKSPQILNRHHNVLSPIIKKNNYSQQRLSPYYNPVRTPGGKGLKMFRSLRHNPITNEFILSKVNYQNFDENENEGQIMPKNNFNNSNNLNNFSNNIIELKKFKDFIMSRGPKGIFIFQKLLIMSDKNITGEISFPEFLEIIHKFNINIDKNLIIQIFASYDKKKNGTIKYNELFTDLLGEININRQKIIQKVFNIFNKDKSGKVSINEIKKKYNFSRHPYVTNNLKTPEEVFYDFADSIEICKNYKNIINLENNDLLSYEDFAMLYKEIGLNIDDDQLFEYLLTKCWNLDQIVNNNNEYNKYIEQRSESLNYSNRDNNVRIRAAGQILNNRNTYY